MSYERKMATKLDHFDMLLLRELQRDATQSQRALSQKVGLSQNACWRRLRQLETAGVIEGRTIVINRHLVGAELVVFVMIKTRHHSEEWLNRFRTHITNIPDVVDFYRIGGEYDYMLKIVTRNMVSYDQVYRKIIAKIDLETVTSLFAMEAIAEQRPISLT